MMGHFFLDIQYRNPGIVSNLLKPSSMVTTAMNSSNYLNIYIPFKNNLKYRGVRVFH